MDIFLKELAYKLFTSIIYIVVYVVFAPIILFLKLKKIFTNNENNYLRGNNLHIFSYYPTYEITKNHKKYLNNIINAHKNDKEYSKKTLLKMIYFSHFFGTCFYHLNLNDRLNIKNTILEKQEMVIWFKKYYLDALDFFWILLREKYQQEQDLNKLLISIVKYSKYKEIGIFNYINNMIDLLLLSHIEEVYLLEFIIIVLDYFQDKEEVFEGKNCTIKSKNVIDVDNFMKRLFDRIELKSENITYQTLKILNFLLSDNDKVDMLVNFIDKEIKKKSITKTDINMFKLTLSLLILLNYDIKAYMQKVQIKLTKEHFNEIYTYTLFYKLNKIFIKSNINEKIKKI